MSLILPLRLRNRYLASTWGEIVERVINGPIVKQHPFYPASPQLCDDMRSLLESQTFVPAGNTLTFGALNKGGSQVAAALQPNCCIVDEVGTEKAKDLWDKGIGVGTTTLNPDENPVSRLFELQRQWNRLKAQHRPMRGNMFVYPARGKFIREFIDAKSTPEKADALPGFNISIGVNSYEPLEDSVLNAVAQAAWATGDPGIVFLDRVNANVPLRHAEKRMHTLVPCGEQGMFDGETCTLGSINLNSTAIADERSGELCLHRFEQAVRLAVTFLDNAVDVCAEQGAVQYRRVGLGVMGFADLLGRLNVPYDSAEARRLASQISSYLGAVARHQSTVLAAQRGMFPRFTTETFLPNQGLLEQDALMGYPRTTLLRNVSVTCIAPTGGITLVTKNRGYAIEPFFHQATQISPWNHLSMAAAWQTGVCNSVSKTINLPEGASVSDVRRAILFAYKTRQLKAVSLYRANSRTAQPMVI